MDQPGAAPPPGCPPGLQPLLSMDHLMVCQKTEMLEVFSGFEGANKYEVKTGKEGQVMFYAKEDNDCCTRMVCGNSRPFEMNIMNTQGQEVMRLDRPLRCSSCWYPCCLQKVEVQSPPGTVIGTVEQEWSICDIKLAIKNEGGDTVLMLKKSTCCICDSNCCQDVDFPILTMDDNPQEVGKISKQWTGVMKEAFTDADNFGVNFPVDLDVKIKATLMAAVFLIDFMYFEKDD